MKDRSAVHLRFYEWSVRQFMIRSKLDTDKCMKRDLIVLDFQSFFSKKRLFEGKKGALEMMLESILPASPYKRTDVIHSSC